MRRRSFLRGILAALVAPVAIMKASINVASGAVSPYDIPMLNIKLRTIEVRTTRRQLKSTWSMLAE